MSRKLAFLLAMSVIGVSTFFGSDMTSPMPAEAATGDIKTCKFSSAQVFDVQWNISGGVLNVSSLTRPYTSSGQLSAGDLAVGDYFQFADATAPGGAASLSFSQFDLNGTVKRLVHAYSTFRAIGADFIFYSGDGSWGTLITTGTGYNYGDAASLTVTTENPPLNPDVLTYATCGSTPLAAGEVRGASSPSPVASPESNPAEGVTLEVSEPSIALEFRRNIGQAVAGSPIEIFGVGLPAKTPYSLTIFQPERELVAGVSNSGGVFGQTVQLPADLPPGSQQVVLKATLPSGEVLQLSKAIEIGADGFLLSIAETVVGPSATPVVESPRLAYTGLVASPLPWLALVHILFGTLLVVYSARARAMVIDETLEIVPDQVKTPWEILAMPIRVPGINYTPGSHSGSEVTASLSDSVREIDVALSRMIGHAIVGLERKYSR